MTGLDRLARLVSAASFVLATGGASLAVAACASSPDPEPTSTSQAGEALSEADAGDDGGNPADRSSLGEPGLVGASPVVPSPWDRLVGGASK